MRKREKKRCFIILVSVCFVVFCNHILYKGNIISITAEKMVGASSIVTGTSINSVAEGVSHIGSNIGQMPQWMVTAGSIFFKDDLKPKIELPIKIPKNKKSIVKELPMGTNKLILHIIQKKNSIVVGWQKLGKGFQYKIYITKEGGVEKLWKTTSAAKVSLSLKTDISYKIRVRVFNHKKKVVVNSEKYRIFLPKKVSKICTCSMEETCVKLSWNASRHTDYYLIYRKEGKNKYKKIGKSEKSEYFDEKIKQGKDYSYRIVPVTKIDTNDFIGTGVVKKFDNKKIVQTDHQKYTYEEMAEDIRSLKQKYNGLINYKIIGKSEDERNIYDVILGNQKADKSILIVSTLHAREYMASLLCMNQIEYYLQNYNKEIDGKKEKDILEKIAIHYIPMANPDGVTISQLGIESIRKEQIREQLLKIAIGSTETWKANANGVDLNKNFPYEFEVLGEAGFEGFSGNAAASESETRAVLNLIDNLQNEHNLQGVINYHAMGSIIFGNCKKEGKLKENTKKMYQIAKKVTGYLNAKEYSSNMPESGDAGNLREYLLYEREIPNITIEIGTISCPGPISEFPSIWERNCDLILREAELFL